MPTLALTCSETPATENGSASVDATRTAAASACSSASAGRSASSRKNSSPPARASMSSCRPVAASRLRHGREQLVADHVTEAVVHELEVVDVEAEEADAPARMLRADDRGGDPLSESGPVREPGERIVIGEVGDALLSPVALGDVLAGAERAGHAAALVAKDRVVPSDQPLLAGLRDHVVLVFAGGVEVAGQELAEQLTRRGALVGRHDQPEPARTGELVLPVAEHVAGAAVHEADLAALVQHDDHRRRHVEIALCARLALGERALRAAELGDVHEHALAADRLAALVTDHVVPLPHPDDAPVGGDHAELVLVVRARVEALDLRSEHPLAIVGMHARRPQVLIGQPGRRREAEHLLDLGAHVEEGRVGAELADDRDRGNLLDQRAVAKIDRDVAGGVLSGEGLVAHGLCGRESRPPSLIGFQQGFLEAQAALLLLLRRSARGTTKRMPERSSSIEQVLLSIRPSCLAWGTSVIWLR